MVQNRAQTTFVQQLPEVKFVDGSQLKSAGIGGQQGDMQQQRQQVAPQTVSAVRVAEVLQAAGEAFCRLGECTQLLDNHSTPTKSKVNKPKTKPKFKPNKKGSNRVPKFGPQTTNPKRYRTDLRREAVIELFDAICLLCECDAMRK